MSSLLGPIIGQESRRPPGPFSSLLLLGLWFGIVSHQTVLGAMCCLSCGGCDKKVIVLKVLCQEEITQSETSAEITCFRESFTSSSEVPKKRYRWHKYLISAVVYILDVACIKLCKIIVALPINTASCKRSFSTLKLAKEHLREWATGVFSVLNPINSWRSWCVCKETQKLHNTAFTNTWQWYHG